MSDAIRFENVTVRAGRTEILQDISLAFPTGKISVLLGPNGCGKTTLLQCLNGLSEIAAGKVFLNETDLTSLSGNERAKRVAFLPQVRSVIPAIPVHTLVEHGRFPYLGFARRMGSADRKAVKDAMEAVGIANLADASVDTLSGGVRQKVFIAMVLAQECDTIVLDEPTTFLDPAAQRDILQILKNLKTQGKTVITVLHDLTRAAEIADFLAVMTRDGRVAAAGNAPDVLSSGAIESVFDVQRETVNAGGKTRQIFY
ncbi:MAG: ABC transporter ATP-binding protein [Succiniclasticum sp.]|nr:ABC transporter ATP-binding protein [Succiniclasticum sp.]